MTHSGPSLCAHRGVRVVAGDAVEQADGDEEEEGVGEGGDGQAHVGRHVVGDTVAIDDRACATRAAQFSRM